LSVQRDRLPLSWRHRCHKSTRTVSAPTRVVNCTV